MRVVRSLLRYELLPVRLPAIFRPYRHSFFLEFGLPLLDNESMRPATVLKYYKNTVLQRLFHKIPLLLIIALLPLSLAACGTVRDGNAAPKEKEPFVFSDEKGSRDNTPVCLVPTAPGTELYEGEAVTIDTSNKENGYFMIRYTGDAPAGGKVKLQVAAPNDVVYTYNLTPGADDTVIPFSLGSGEYTVSIFTNIKDNMYALADRREISVQLADELSPFLYPNQYVQYNSDTEAVDIASRACLPANSDLDAVSMIYNYVISTLEYDYDKARTVQSGYLPRIDEILAAKKGICFDYASLICAMLRSQRIPARLEIGYAGQVYHAWISTHISEIGWVNGMIRFDGTTWSLMDPTLASNGAGDLKEFIGSGDNYRTVYMY